MFAGSRIERYLEAAEPQTFLTPPMEVRIAVAHRFHLPSLRHITTRTAWLMIGVSGPRSGSVDVAAMFDAQDDDLVSVLVDAVKNPEGATASTEDAPQLVPQRSPDPPRVREQ